MQQVRKHLEFSRIIPGNIKSEWSNIRGFIGNDELRKTGSLQSDQKAKEFTRKELPDITERKAEISGKSYRFLRKISVLLDII